MPLWESIYEESGDEERGATHTHTHTHTPGGGGGLLTPSCMRRDQYGVMIKQVKLLKRLTEPSQTDCSENPVKNKITRNGRKRWNPERSVRGSSQSRGKGIRMTRLRRSRNWRHTRRTRRQGTEEQDEAGEEHEWNQRDKGRTRKRTGNR